MSRLARVPIHSYRLQVRCRYQSRHRHHCLRNPLSFGRLDWQLQRVDERYVAQ